VTTRAAKITAGRVVEVVDAPVPDPGPGEVRLRLEGCGVCGSDLPVWAGRPWFDYPREPGAPGHEGWGVVDAVGPGVDGVDAGDRVAGLTYRAYAGHDVAKAGDLVPLPDGVDVFPGEALGCAVNVVRRSGIRDGDRVAVVGAGFLGSVVVQLAAADGAHVTAISRRESALDVARAMGAHETLALGEEAGLEPFDVVVEAAGVQATLDTASALVRERGRLVIAGFHQDGPRQVDMQSWNWRGIDVINAHERDARVYVAGIREAAAAIVAGRLDPSPLYTHRFGLDDVGDALDTALERPDGFMKALVLA
jgi:threonine dehydrogenase-like Zn-dependent dehydrogenase